MSAIQNIFQIYGLQYLSLHGERMPKLLKKPFKISLIAEVVLSEQSFTVAMIVKTYSPFHVAASATIARPRGRSNDHSAVYTSIRLEHTFLNVLQVFFNCRFLAHASPLLITVTTQVAPVPPKL